MHFKKVEATKKKKIPFWPVQRAASPTSKQPLVCDTWETGMLYEDAFPGIPYQPWALDLQVAAALMAQYSMKFASLFFKPR